MSHFSYGTEYTSSDNKINIEVSCLRLEVRSGKENTQKKHYKGTSEEMCYMEPLISDDWHHINVEGGIGRQPFSLIGKI